MTEIHDTSNLAGRRLARKPVWVAFERPVGLFQAISEFVTQLPNSQLQSVAAANAPLGYQSKVLLGVLTFFYAQGLYPSAEIETALSRDASLRALCGQEYPSAHLLRRFRRCNRDLLRECLAYALARVRGGGQSRVERRSEGGIREQAAADGLKFSYLQEAERHLEEAVLRDTVELDD